MKNNAFNFIDNVKKDFKELKEVYPFSDICILPKADIAEVVVNVVAVNKRIITETKSEKEDYCGEYSRFLKVVVPNDYKTNGCNVYGGDWIDNAKVSTEDKHFSVTRNGIKLCVGVPESFSKLDNVLLENVRTAENMLIAYEKFIKGYSSKLCLNCYSHGEKGKDEYKKDARRFR